MLRIKKTCLILFAAIFAASCGKEKATKAEKHHSDDPLACIFPCEANLPKLSKAELQRKRNKVEHFAKKLWRDYDNYAFLVAQNGQIIYEDYNGFANKYKDEKIGAETPIHIASVSKSLTAAAILQLVNRGEITLDQKVNTLLKTFPYDDITIRMLLNHRSGLKNYAYFCDRPEIWNRKDTVTNADILRLFGEKNIPRESRADTRFAYCNTNYAMLALIIEKVTGVKYGEAMDRMIFKPLGMKNTFVFDIHKDKARVSLTYKGNMPLAFDHLDAVYGDKNIYSTPRDLMKFDLATYDPDFLDKALFDQVFKGYSYESKGEKNYGLGLRMIEWKTGQKFYFHNGWWHGNTSSYVTLRKEKVTIIALSNKYTKKTYMVRKLAPSFGDYPFKKDKADEMLE
ncbi:Penicillin-binding protein [Flavobacterium longum]|uniref:serine hydrolase domain-containing protein n=1 Tax=Flavobacterium longum TaxID=1299340 RepID=UPI0039E73F1E